MTYYFRSKAGNKVIGIDADRVTEYDLLFTMGDERCMFYPTTTDEIKTKGRSGGGGSGPSRR